MELLALTVLLAIVVALAIAFGAESRPGFGDNEEATEYPKGR